MVSEANRHARARRRRRFLRLGIRCHQGSQSHRVVRGYGKCDNPVDQRFTTVAQFPQAFQRSSSGQTPARRASASADSLGSPSGMWCERRWRCMVSCARCAGSPRVRGRRRRSAPGHTTFGTVRRRRAAGSWICTLCGNVVNDRRCQEAFHLGALIEARSGAPASTAPPPPCARQLPPSFRDVARLGIVRSRASRASATPPRLRDFLPSRVVVSPFGSPKHLDRNVPSPVPLSPTLLIAFTR